jgi:hypothetical protein
MLRTHEKLIFLNEPLQFCNEGNDTLEYLMDVVIMIIQKKQLPLLEVEMLISYRN